MNTQDPVVTKPGYQTTEFWLTLLTSLVGSLLASGLIGDDRILKILGVVSTILATAGYTTARTITKGREEKVKSEARAYSQSVAWVQGLMPLAASVLEMIRPGGGGVTVSNTGAGPEAKADPDTKNEDGDPFTNLHEDHLDVSFTPHETRTFDILPGCLGKTRSHLAIRVNKGSEFLIENVIFGDKPYWTSGVDAGAFATDFIVVCDDVIEAGTPISIVVTNTSDTGADFRACFKIWSL